MKKILLLVFLCFSFLLPLAAPIKAYAVDNADGSSTMNPLKMVTNTQEEFNRSFLSSLVGRLINNSVVGWNNGGLVKTIFTICFLIAFVKAINNTNPNAMLNEMTLLAVWTWLVLALLGGPTYQKLEVLSVADSRYQTTGMPSLDVDIFNWAAYQADQVAASMFDASSPYELVTAQLENKTMLKNMLNARQYCKDNSATSACMKCFIGPDNDYGRRTAIDNPYTAGCLPQSAEASESGSWFLPQIVVDMLVAFATITNDMMAFVFVVISFLIDILRSLLNMVILITFGIITGMSFFIMKIIYPFAVLPKFRPRVWAAMKIPLSATLYSLATSLVVFISSETFIALNNAAANMIAARIKDGNILLIGPQMQIINLTVMVGGLAVLIFQLYAIPKIPRMCKDLLDLSFDTVRSVTGEAVSAGGEMAVKVGAAMATGGTSLLAGVGGKVAGVVSGGFKGYAGRAAAGVASGGGRAFGPAGSSQGGGNVARSAAGRQTASVGGVDVALGDAAPRGGGGSTSSVAQSIAQERVIPEKTAAPSSGSSRGPAGMSAADEEIVAKGMDPEATEEEKVAATELMNRRKEDRDAAPKTDGGEASSGAGKFAFGDRSMGTWATDLALAGIAAGASNEGPLLGLMRGINKGAQDKSVGGIKDKFKQLNGGEEPDSAMVAFRREKAASEQAVKNMVSNFGRPQTRNAAKNEELGRVFHNTSEQGRSKAHDGAVNQAMSDIRSGNDLSNGQVDILTGLRQTDKITKEESREIDQALDQKVRESIAKIEQGDGSDEDFARVFKAENGDYASASTREKIEGLEGVNNEYFKYASDERKTNEKLNADLDRGLNDKRGVAALLAISERTSSGMMGDRKGFTERAADLAPAFNEKKRSEMYEESRTLIKDHDRAVKSNDLDAQQRIARTLASNYEDDPQAFAGKDREATLNDLNAIIIGAGEISKDQSIKTTDPELYEMQQRQAVRRYKSQQEEMTQEVAYMQKELEAEVAQSRSYRTDELRIGNVSFIRDGKGGIDPSMYGQGDDVRQDFSKIDQAVVTQIETSVTSFETRLQAHRDGSAPMSTERVIAFERKIQELKDILTQVRPGQRS